MRGARTDELYIGETIGIIPADAGSTTPLTSPVESNTDHPRGCGEHLITSLQSLTTSGSFPRMRGAH